MDADARPEAQRSRGALLAAFRDLVLSGRYDELKVSQIVSRARVARSTFYAHFQNKDELLLAGLSDPLSALADAVLQGTQSEALTETLAHFWENRRVTRALLSGPMRERAMRLLVELIETRLASLAGASLRLPLRLLARQIAGGQIGLLTAWVGGEASARPAELAAALQATSQAMAAAGRSC